jgi:F1F0 ATPase subunit 2
MGLGIFYFAGLWLTVRKLPTARRPFWMGFLGFCGRLAVVLTGFYFLMGGRWERLIVSLVAFVAVRTVLVRIWGPDLKGLQTYSELAQKSSSPDAQS